jgi:hypothetical protein
MEQFLLKKIYRVLELGENDFSIAILAQTNIDEFTTKASDIETIETGKVFNIYDLSLLIPFCLYQQIFDHQILDNKFDIDPNGVLYLYKENKNNEVYIIGIRPSQMTLNDMELLTKKIAQHNEQLTALIKEV